MKKLMLVLFLSFSLFATPKTIVLTAKNSVALRGTIDGQTTAKLMAKLLELDLKLQKNKPIYLVIYSPGGEIDAGYTFIEFAKQLNRPIHTITIFAASMAFIIVQSLDTRYIFEQGTLMAHKAQGGFRGEFPGQIDARYSFWLKKLENFDQKVAKRLKISIKKWQQKYENEYWISGFDALISNFADQPANFKCSKSLTGETKETFQFWGTKFLVTWSACPLIPDPLSVEVAGSPEAKTKNKVLDIFYRPMNPKLIRELNTFPKYK